MVTYTLKRLGAALLTLLIIMAITFFLMNAIPGSPFLTEKSTPQSIELANKKYGLDKPLIVQFKNYVFNYLQGDLGVSLKMQEGTPVSKIIFEQGKFEISIKLGLCALALAIVIGIPLGYGLVGMWIGFALDENVRGVILVRRWRSGKWKSKGFVKEGSF